MTWIRIESGFFRHRKVLDLPIPSKLLFIGGLCYSAENGTDGHISRSALRVLAAELDVKPVTTALEEAGLWHKQADGWDIHDYLAYQPSAEQERQRRQETADRVKAWRDQRKRKAEASRGDTNSTTGNAPRNSVTPPVTNDVTDPVRNGLVTLSPNPNPNPVDTSSSSSPVSETSQEEEDEFVIEARRRLLTTPTQVNNPEAWIRKTALRLRLEGYAASDQPQPIAHPANNRRPDCPTCDGLSLVESDGGYVPCPDCTRSATA